MRSYILSIMGILALGEWSGRAPKIGKQLFDKA